MYGSRCNSMFPLCLLYLYFVSELGGCCPTLSKFLVLGFSYVMGSPHRQNIHDPICVDAGTITYKFLLILVSTTIYIFVQRIFTWKLNLPIYVHVHEFITSKHCVPKLFTKESS